MSSKEPALSPRAAELKAQANDFFKREDFEKAHELFTAAIAEESSSPALYSNRSATCVKLKKYKAALKDAEKTVKLDPNWDKAHGRVATAQELLCQRQEALISYYRAASLARTTRQRNEYMQSAARVYTNSKTIVDDRIAKSKRDSVWLKEDPLAKLQMLREQGHKYEQDSAAYSFAHTSPEVKKGWENVQKLRKVTTMSDGTPLPTGAQFGVEAPPTVLDDMMILVANIMNEPNAFMYPGHEHWSKPQELVEYLGLVFHQISTLPKKNSPSEYVKFADALYRRQGWENQNGKPGARNILALAIRHNILTGFCLELMLNDFGSAYIRYNWAYQVIKLGREKWPRMWTAHQAGTSFSQTFQRSVRCRMIECKIGLAGVLGANAANEIKEIEAMAMGQLKSCQQYPVQRPATDVVWQWQLWMGFDVSIRANAFMALAFVNRARAERNASSVGHNSYIDPEYGRLAMENYLKAACLFPEDCRLFARAMWYALEMQMRTGDVSLAAMDSMIAAAKASEEAYDRFHGPLDRSTPDARDFVLEHRELLMKQAAKRNMTDPQEIILKRIPRSTISSFRSSLLGSKSSGNDGAACTTIIDIYANAKTNRQNELTSIENGVFVDD